MHFHDPELTSPASLDYWWPYFQFLLATNEIGSILGRDLICLWINKPKPLTIGTVNRSRLSKKEQWEWSVSSLTLSIIVIVTYYQSSSITLFSERWPMKLNSLSLCAAELMQGKRAIKSVKSVEIFPTFEVVEFLFRTSKESLIENDEKWKGSSDLLSPDNVQFTSFYAFKNGWIYSPWMLQ